MRISFVIPAYNEEKYIAQCVESIFSCPREHVHEVIVVDNGSTDHTKEIVESLQKKYGSPLRLIPEPQKGIMHARHTGFVAATGDYIASIDADCRPNPTWLAAIREEFQNHPEILVMSGPYAYYDIPWHLAVIKFLKNLLLDAPLSLLSRQERSKLMGGNFVAKRDPLLRIQQDVDRSIVFYGEDTELRKHLKKLGPIKYSRRCAIPSSARRWTHEGIVRTFLRYRLNGIYQRITGRSLLKRTVEKDWR